MGETLRTGTAVPWVPPWASRSMRARHLRSLASVHPVLQVAHAAMQAAVGPGVWLYIFVGHRGRQAQEAAFAAGRSRARWGQSRHNPYPALAMDLWPVFEDRPRVLEWGAERARRVLEEAADFVEGVLSWGGRWRSFRDLPHFELPVEGELVVGEDYRLRLLVEPRRSA